MAERSGSISLCGGNPPRKKIAVAEIRRGGKIIAVAEIRRGGKKSLWRKKIAVAENRRGGKNRCGGNPPWRKKIAVAKIRRGGKNRCGGKNYQLKTIDSIVGSKKFWRPPRKATILGRIHR